MEGVKTVEFLSTPVFQGTLMPYPKTLQTPRMQIHSVKDISVLVNTYLAVSPERVLSTLEGASQRLPRAMGHAAGSTTPFH